MDYLDPKKKREHKIRLLIGYALFAVAIAFATLILVYLANGYYVDRNTGEVIQNGLVYVDSIPGGASVKLNGELQRGKTDVRLVIPSGTYSIELNKEGYRSWSRSLVLEGGSLRQLTYARLIPEALVSAPRASMRAEPSNISQSIDRKWLVFSYLQEPLQLDLLDTSGSSAPVSLTIPSTAVTKGDGGVIKVLEWADDNRFFLATYVTTTSIDYLLIDRENPAQSQNLGNSFGNSKASFSLQERKRDKFFVYDEQTKSLSTATLSGGLAPSPFLTNVLAHKTYGNDWVLYITPSSESGYVEARFMRGQKDILIKKIREDKKYLLEIAEQGNAPVLAFSSPVENRVIVYNDPENYLNHNPNSTIPVATTVLRVEAPIGVSLSADSSVVLAYGPDNFATHEFEADRSYNFSATGGIDKDQKLIWQDGQHFLFSSNGIQNIMDFDGSNQFALVSSSTTLGSYFSKDYDLMFALNIAVLDDKGAVVTPTQLTVTNMLLPADR